MIKVKISGTEYKTASRYSIRNASGSMTTTSVDVLIDDGFIPQALQPVEILDDDTPIFFGYIETSESPSFSTGFEPKLWRLNVYSGEKVFDFRLVNDAWADKKTHDIVLDIYNDYIAPEGIALGEISICDYEYESYSASFQKCAECLEELAEVVDAQYFISENKMFYFVIKDAIVTVDAPPHITALQKSQTARDVRTVQTILGASEETTNQIENFIWADSQTTALLGYQVSEIVGVTINGAPVGFGVRGIDEADTSVTFLYEFGTQVLTVNNDAITKPTEGQNVVVIYRGYYDIIVISENEQLKEQLSALNGTSGKIEHVTNNETIDNYTDAQTLADALLARYGEMESEISCRLDSTDNTSLMTGWRFAYPDFGIVGDYVIVERTIEDFGPYKMRVTIKLKNRGLFSRYGTVYKKKEKKEKRDIIVYKSSIFGDVLTLRDAVTFNAGGMIYFPTSSGLTDPELGGFFPAWG